MMHDHEKMIRHAMIIAKHLASGGHVHLTHRRHLESGGDSGGDSSTDTSAPAAPAAPAAPIGMDANVMKGEPLDFAHLNLPQSFLQGFVPTPSKNVATPPSILGMGGSQASTNPMFNPMSYSMPEQAALAMPPRTFARGGYADGGETDPMLDQDTGIAPEHLPTSYTQPPEPYYNAGSALDSSTPISRAFNTMTGGRSLQNDILNIEERLPNLNTYGEALLRQRDATQDFNQKSRQNIREGYANKDLPQMALGYGQGALGLVNPALAPINALFDIGSETAGKFDPRLKAEADVVGLFGTEGSGALAKAGNLMHDYSLPTAGTLAMAAAPAKAGEVERALEITKAPRSDLGFYSHGAETAANLPQAKGTPQQFKSMLEKNGVKPAEMEGFDEAFAGRPTVTREEIAQHFNENMPQVEEKVFGYISDTKQSDMAIDYWLEQNHYKRLDDAAEELGVSERTLRNSILEDENNFKNITTTKYSDQTLPGGENYREVRLTIPSEEYANRKAMIDARTEKDKLVDQYGAMTDRDQAKEFYPQVQEAIKKYNDSVTAFQNSPKSFTSSHWDDPNVLAHVRMSDRTGPNGEKLLHVEELQSDWGQKGRSEGFSDPESTASAKEKTDQFSTQYDQLGRERRLAEQEMAGLPDYNERFHELQNRVSEIGRQRDLLSDQMASLRSTFKGNAVPTAPYVTNTQGWTDLALKRVMKEAAEGDYDGVVFTPGAEQAKRYDLSNHVDSVHYDPVANRIMGFKDRENVFRKDNVTKNELPSIVGKDVADKLLNSEIKQSKLYDTWNPEVHPSDVHTLEGQDLSVGGEGMKGYYDKIVPTQLQKLVKGYDKDAKLGTMRTNSLPDMLHLPMTDKMRQSILSGQKAFARGGEIEPVNVNHALNLSHQFGPAAAQDAVSTAKQLARGRP